MPEVRRPDIPDHAPLASNPFFLACLRRWRSLVWRGLHWQLGANPIEAITHATGDWTLTFLLITLSVTPLRKLTRQYWLISLRRMFGLFAFFYGTLHLMTYVGSTSFSTFTKCWPTSPSASSLPRA